MPQIKSELNAPILFYLQLIKGLEMEKVAEVVSVTFFLCVPSKLPLRLLNLYSQFVQFTSSILN